MVHVKLTVATHNANHNHTTQPCRVSAGKGFPTIRAVRIEREAGREGGEGE